MTSSLQPYKKYFRNIGEALLHLAFPHLCHGCGSDRVHAKEPLCLRCLSSLPNTNFHAHADNPVEKLFWGRMHVKAAAAQYFFTRGSLMQKLMHQLKYKGNRDIGVYLGRFMGETLATCSRFATVEALVPLPLFRSREHKRGYNQAALLCAGIASVMHVPVLKDLVIRTTHTETQTRKGRIERWENIKDRFMISNQNAGKDKHVLLVDDVVTTGATLEACGRELTSVPGLRLSIAALCFSSH